MAKIWEVDFTAFSGSSDVALDTVGSGHLITPTGTGSMNKVSPLPGFTVRPGITFLADNSGMRYDITNTDAPKAQFSDSYTQRSFVCFYYASGSNWDSGTSALWADFLSSGTTIYEGWHAGGSQLKAEVRGLTPVTYPSSFITTSGWKLVVLTMDKGSSQTYAYGRSDADDYNSSAIAYTAFTNTRDTHIGALSATREMKGSLGYLATYDTVLSSGMVDTIWETFLTDSLVGNPPATVSGYIYDDTESTISGADVMLFYNDNLSVGLAGYDTTTGSGTYEIDVPFFGDYTLVSSNPPNDGARAVSFTLSGTPGSGSITFHDGS